jgi:FAD/FMN-containing dehydrogenase
MLTAAAIGDLRRSFRGALLEPTDAGYDAARKVWNGMIDKRPALIARCTETSDVKACVNFAREHDVAISVRGGGHNFAGKAVCDGGLMIGELRVRQAYGTNYERSKTLKQRYDPTNLFRQNRNIKPN